MSKDEIYKYEGDGFEISFNKKVCAHAAVCVKTLPNVFDIDKKPWINTSGATSLEISEMIKNCPSGALEFNKK